MNHQRDLAGGLNTDLPAVAVQPTQSPDLLNVLFRNGAVSKRGGFIPRFKDRMRMNAVRNTGYASTARGALAGANTSYRIVPGCLVAGHRHIYEGATALSCDLFYEVGDLTSEHGGNAQTAGTIATSPYTVKVRPILSKGPVKRTQDTVSPPRFNNAAIAWNTTVDTVWGDHGSNSEGMPFCLYLWNNGTGAVPVWQIRLSAHVLVAGSWTLQTVTSSVTPVVGAQYHIVAAVSGSRVALRVAQVRGSEALSYTANEATFTGTLAWNKCPVQVFDCPQQLIEATTVGSATQRPGFNLTAATVGGYWFSAMRAEGRIEDLAIWQGDKFSSVATTLDRDSKLDQERATALINYWSFDRAGTDSVQEVTGRGNDMFFVPRGPCLASGGKDGAAWFFNGQTSYALCDVDAPSWRYFNTTQLAAMLYLVRNNLDHGMHVQFAVDSIEPQFEQVIAEIHGVMRLAITTTGLLRVYVRSGGGAANSFQLLGLEYQTGATGTTVLQAGERYSVAVLRNTLGAAVTIYLNGVQEATGAVTQCTPTDSRPPSGVTVGMGSYEAMIRSATLDPAAAAIAPINDVNTDSRSGFVGRVECLKLLAGQGSHTLSPTSKQENVDDWRNSESRAWRNVNASRNVMRVADPSDTTRQSQQGAVFLIDGQTQAGVPVLFAITGDTGVQYGIHANTLDDTAAASGLSGHFDLDAVGARIYSVLAFWLFTQDDRDNGYACSYVLGLERRYNSVDASDAANYDGNRIDNPTKHTHVQFSAVADELGVFNSVQKRCAESDVISELNAALFTTPAVFTARHRPYAYRSPREIGPRWAQGMVRTLPGKAPVTLIANWSVQTEARTFTITAAGRQVYWARPAWESSSPYVEAGPMALSCPGQGSHAFVRATNAGFNYSGTGTKTTVTFECWLKPDRLDGRRLIAARMAPATSQSQASWFVSTIEGSIEVQGTLATGARAWGFSEGTGAATAALKRASSLRVGKWNHLIVTLNTAGCVVRVNGSVVPMLDLSTLTGSADRRDAHTSAAGDNTSNELYLCGLPLGRETINLTIVAGGTGAVSVVTSSWAGLISDVRVKTTEDTTTWPAGLSGYPPISRLADVASTILLLPCNEGSGWLLTNGAAATVGEDADVVFREYVLLAEGLEESSGSRYDWLPYRDTLLLTNGASRPQRITYDGRYSNPQFRVEQMGVDMPVVAINRTVANIGGAGSTIPPATYSVWMSFITKDGRESEPNEIAAYVHSPASLTLAIRINWLPRSDDPQVVGRKLYSSPPGGGLPVFNRQVGNDGYQHEVLIYATGGEGLLVGTRLPVPRGKHIALAGAAMVVADLTDEPAGQNAFAFSQPAEPSYFTTASTAVVDSKDGKALVGIQSNLTSVFLSKRDAIYQAAVGAIVTATEVEASIRPVNDSDGVGAGDTNAQNLIYGCGERGAFVFDGSNLNYLSRPIEPTWQQIADRSNEALRTMQGAYVRAFSEYWLSLRRRGAIEKTDLLVMDLESQSWWLLTAPEHRTMEIVESVDGQQQDLLIGTTSGAVMHYQESVFVDGSNDAKLSNAAQTLSGDTGLSGSGTSLSMAGANFDTTLGGLAGIEVEIVYNGGTATRRIVSNTAGTLRWLEPLAGWSSFTSFAIGGYEGRWTSPWITESDPNREQNLLRVSAELIPDAVVSDLTIRVASVRQTDQVLSVFPTVAAAYEEFTRPQSTGWLVDMPMPRTHNRGHYHRVQFSTRGVRTPFGLVGYGLQIVDASATAHAGRTT